MLQGTSAGALFLSGPIDNSDDDENSLFSIFLFWENSTGISQIDNRSLAVAVGMCVCS